MAPRRVPGRGSWPHERSKKGSKRDGPNRAPKREAPRGPHEGPKRVARGSARRIPKKSPDRAPLWALMTEPARQGGAIGSSTMAAIWLQGAAGGRKQA